MRPRRPVPAPPKKFDFIRSRPKPYGALAVCFLILAGIGAAVWYERATWQAYKTDSQNVAPEVAAQFDQALSQESLSLGQVDQLSTDISARAESMCKLSPVRKVRLAVSDDARQTRDTCEQSKQKVKQLAANLKNVDNRLQREAQLSDRLENTQTDLSSLSGRDFAKYKLQWSTARQAIIDQDVETSLAPVKQSTVDAIDGIIHAYELLGKAEAAKNRDAYDTAINQLQSGHDTLNDTQAAARASYRTLLDKLADSRVQL